MSCREDLLKVDLRDKDKANSPSIKSAVDGELSSSRVSWIMKRHYTEEGTLVITGAKSKHHNTLTGTGKKLAGDNDLGYEL
ncbi:hypothetical protein DM860_006955 [Cuscuta australis]|uniref:Uncharacterized protein n=1 Tax=Cuscuta australis TaxID=267555 RepID=A0A328E9Q0_9ASTE|nr:hypothetical protein DM860_006955 [Cuscuta australis]